MADSIANASASRHLPVPDVRPRMAKADLRKAEIVADAADLCWKTRVGKAIERTQHLAGMTLKEFAAAVQRDERQIARWMTGAERPQIDAIFAVDKLRAPVVVALAELAHDIEVITEIRVRRSIA